MTISECRVVQHKLGEVCIPTQPQRVVALDPRYILDHLLSLEINPIGYAAYPEGEKIYLVGIPPEEVQDIEYVGSASQPSLEKIAVLKPDLILTINEQTYRQLLAIAPSVLIDYDEIKNSFKKNLRIIARLFDREEKAEEVISAYESRIKQIRDSIGEKLDKIEISVVVQHHGEFWAMSAESGISQVLADIGIEHTVPSSSVGPFSIEKLSKYDADIMFFLNADNRPVSYFFQHPIISSLEAVKNNRAYVVDPDIWWAYGPIGINRLLNELSQHLSQSLPSL
ncbi:MAG: ABC transporter substrate-binding protein [Leptolyngbyaceae cyanobacterium]